jgi:hypothetical protein
LASSRPNCILLSLLSALCHSFVITAVVTIPYWLVMFRSRSPQLEGMCSCCSIGPVFFVACLHVPIAVLRLHSSLLLHHGRIFNRLVTTEADLLQSEPSLLDYADMATVARWAMWPFSVGGCRYNPHSPCYNSKGWCIISRSVRSSGINDGQFSKPCARCGLLVSRP